MSVTDADIAHALDLFASVTGLRVRKQTGAALLYADDVLFATGGDGEIYLKARGAFARDIERAGAVQSSIARADGSRGSNCHWTLPIPARDDPAIAGARRAIAALANRKGKTS